MLLLERIQSPIAENIKSYEEFIVSNLGNENRHIASICNYIMQNRGKQIRPLLVLLSSALHGGITEKSYMGALVVEMIHTASLIHDDVVDQAFMRRGKPSINALWDSHTAILIGDYIFARTFHSCIEHDNFDIIKEITQSVHLVSEGELIQSRLSESLKMTEPLYLDIIYKKTATMIESSAAIGAFSCEASEREIELIRSYGKNLGIAFQIKDDILDYAPSEQTGKPMCGDLRERKITMPLLYVLDNSTKSEHDKLIAKLSDIRSNPSNADYLHRAVVEGGGIDYATQIMTRYSNAALDSLESYPASPIKESLTLLVEYLSNRSK